MREPTPSTGIAPAWSDIFYQYRSGFGTIALPKFNTMNAVVGCKEQGVVHSSHVVNL